MFEGRILSLGKALKLAQPSFYTWGGRGQSRLLLWGAALPCLFRLTACAAAHLQEGLEARGGGPHRQQAGFCLPGQEGQLGRSEVRQQVQARM